MSNSVFTPTVLTVPASGGGTGTGQGEINLITDSIGASGGTGWSATGLTVTRDTSGSPLDPVVATGWTLTATAASQYFTSTTIAVPSSLRNRKLKIEFYYTQVSGSAFRLEVSRNSGFTNDFVLTTDVSGITNLPATAGTTGKFTAYFDADSTSPIYVRLGSTGAGVIKITQIVVGPGIQPQGAVVGEWTNYTATIQNLPTSTVSTRWRRVGASMEVEGFVVASGAATGSILVNIPSGYTVDSTKLGTTAANRQTVLGEALANNGTTNYPAIIGMDYNFSTVGLIFNSASTTSIWNASTPFTWANTNWFSFQARVPIAEWAGSGTLTVAQNDVEYAYNTTAWGTTNTSSGFGYGPAGASVNGALSAFFIQRVQFQSPIQPGDRLIVEGSADGKVWLSLPNNRLGTVRVQNSISSGDTDNAGVELLPVVGSTTQVDVVFARYASIANDDAPANAWPSSCFWRVRKSSAGAAVGFGIVQPGVSAGLVSASGLPGNTTGNAIASGYVGEFTETSVGPQAAAASNTPFNVGFVDIPAGRWKVEAVGSFAVGTVAGNTGFVFDLNTTSATLRTGRFVLGTTLSAAQNGGLSTYSLDINVASTTRVYLVGQYNFTSVGTSTMSGYIKYTRIA